MSMIPPAEQNIVARLQAQQQRVQQQRPTDSFCSGEYRFRGRGAEIIEAPFPVWFSQRPIFVYGFAMGEGFEPAIGDMPTCSALVTRWHIANRTDGFDGYYIGANIAATVVGGLEHQELYLTWLMYGVALRNPVRPTVSGGGINT